MDKTKLYQEIGKYQVRFQSVEMMIEVLLNGLLTLPQNHSDMIFSKLSFRNKVDLLLPISTDIFMNSADYDPEVDVQNMEELVSKLGALEDQRNQITHSFWLESVGGDEQNIRWKIGTNRKKGLKHTFVSYTIDDLKVMNSSIEEILGKIDSMTSKIAIKYDRFHMFPRLEKFDFKIPIEGIIKHQNSKNREGKKSE